MILLLVHSDRKVRGYTETERPHSDMGCVEKSTSARKEELFNAVNTSPAGFIVSPARFIVLEGIDQAGKKTQTRLLLARLRKSGFKTTSLSFPIYNTPAGRQIRAFLSGRSAPPLEALHMLYSLNRWETKKRILETLNSYDVLVSDRYTPSNLAYGTAHGLSLRWLEGLDEGLPKPDIVIVIDVPVRSAFNRKKQRRDIHESDRAFLLRVKRAYLRLAHRYHWKIVKGTGPPEQTHENIGKIVMTTL